MRVCLLYIDNIVILLTILFTRHANILVYLHKYISWYIAKFSFIVFFFFSSPPTSPLNVLQFCFAARRARIKKNSNNTLSHLSRSNNSTPHVTCNCFQVFCSQVLTYKGLFRATTGGLGEETAGTFAVRFYHHGFSSSINSLKLCFQSLPGFNRAGLISLHFTTQLKTVGFYLTKLRLA